MKIRGLQQQVLANHSLLPSQQDVLTRLFFQLAFNNFSHVALVGAEGSGKSTLALILAELLSDCQEMTVNVALISLPLTGEELRQQLAQNWFANPALSITEIEARLKSKANTEFVLLLDNADFLQESDWSWLQPLAVRIFCFCQRNDSRMQLNLSLPAVTLTDCQQLLQAERFDAITLAERFAHSQGNLHVLLGKNSPKVTKPVAALRSSLDFPWPLAVLTLAIAVLVLFIWLIPTETEQPIAPLGNIGTELVAESIPSPDGESVVLVPENAETEVEPVIKDTISLVATADITEPANTDLVVAENAEITADAALAQTEVSHVVIPTVEKEDVVTVVKPSQMSDKSTMASSNITPEHPLLSWQANKRLVQLAVLSEQQAIARFKADFPTVRHLVYQRRWQGREQWVIVAGPFDTNNNAQQFIETLPPRLKSSGPFSKSVRSVQQEILAWQRSAPAVTEQGN